MILMRCMSAWSYSWFGAILTTLLAVAAFLPGWLSAQGIFTFSDTISTSAPTLLANHTLSFTIGPNVNPGSQFEITPPPDFSVLASSTFSADRNVEMRVNGVVRSAGATLGPSTDMVEIVPGSPGLIRYTLNSSTGISAGSQIEIRIGNHTSNSLQPTISTSTVFSTSTGTTTATTTTPGDSPGIFNASTTGTHRVSMRVLDGGSTIARTNFLISLVEQVGVGPVDTRSTVPPILSNGQPSGVVSGVVSGVEVSVETNKFAYCRYATTPGVIWENMTNEFDRGNDFWVLHTFTIPQVENDTEYSFFVRCIDLEGNINQEDFEIAFRIGTVPTGTPDPDGEVEGDGTGSGDGGDEGQSDDGSGDSGTGTEGPDTTDGANVPSSGGGGGGGGSSGSSGSGSGGGFEETPGPFESGDGRVIINGFAHPQSTMVILVDGTEATRVTANAEGRYTATIDGIARGVYTFGVYGIDQRDIRSSTFSTSFTVSGARTTALSNINVPPSIQITPDPVDPGNDVTIRGFTVPGGTVTLEHQREGSAASRQTFTITAGPNGAWQQVLDTSGFTSGPHQVRARVQTESSGQSNFSSYVRYGVGAALADTVNADLNRDGRVNLVDFSILLFWWGTDGGNSDPPADINRDGVVNLVDFSILLFNWTG